jgi:hypothetical protein
MMTVSERVQAVAQVAQSVAIILGVGFSIHEFVLKDRDSKRQLIALTLVQIDKGQQSGVLAARARLEEMYDLAYRTPSEDGEGNLANASMTSTVSSRFNAETLALGQYYNLLVRCAEAGFCEDDLVNALVCESALQDANLVSELVGRIGRFLQTPHFRGLAKLQKNCRDLNYGMSSAETSDMWR